MPGGVISANAFIYNMSRHQWTLLDLGGSRSSRTTLYGIWQDGGDKSPIYALAGGFKSQRCPAGLPDEL